MDKQVKISIASHQTLTALAAKKDRSLKDFLEQCINYFKVTELDPKEIDSEGIKAEIKKLDRRMVSFFKVQEKEKIAPIVEELSIISKAISSSLSIAPSKKDFAVLSAAITDNIRKVIESQNSMAFKMTENRVAEINLTKQKARKIFQEYLQEVDNKSAIASRKPIDEKYQVLFAKL